MKRVSLSFLADALEETDDSWQQFYNTKTGEVELSLTRITIMWSAKSMKTLRK